MCNIWFVRLKTQRSKTNFLLNRSIPGGGGALSFARRLLLLCKPFLSLAIAASMQCVGNAFAARTVRDGEGLGYRPWLHCPLPAPSSHVKHTCQATAGLGSGFSALCAAHHTGCQILVTQSECRKRTFNIQIDKADHSEAEASLQGGQDAVFCKAPPLAVLLSLAISPCSKSITSALF